MPSTYSTNLKIELQATGENSGTWGTITNTNLGTALEQAIVGYGNPDFGSDANLTLSYTDTNAAQAARALVLNVTSTGSLSATRELIVPTIQKQYIVQNNTTGSQSITVKTSAGTGITVPNGRKAHLYVDGTNVIYMDDYVDINGGSIDGTTIGANSAAAGTFTTLGATTGNITTVNATTVDATNVEVTNIKAKDGTAAATIADSTGVVSLSANPVLSGGTANGVLYLNGSKVATSGSVITYDGTTFGVDDAVVINESGGDNDTRIEGDTDANLFFVDASTDRIGIGTSSPAAKLDVAGDVRILNSGADSQLLIVAPTDSYAPAVRWAVSGIRNSGILGFPAADDALVYRSQAESFSTGTECFRVTVGGNFGIGTSSPANRLEVASGTGYQDIAKFRTADSTAANNSGGGFSGVSSATAGSREAYVWLDADGANFSGGDYFYILKKGNSGDTSIWQQSSASLIFGTANTERMRLDSSGNLGIGTSSPAVKLEVLRGSEGEYLRAGGDDTGNNGRGLRFTSSTNSGFIGAKHTLNAPSAGGAIAFATASTERAVIDSSGNLGLGVTPSAWTSSYSVLQFGVGASLATYKSSVLDELFLSANAFENTSGNWTYIGSAATSQYWQAAGKHIWRTAASGTAGNTITFTQAMTLDASGNLGVGITSPAARLHVEAGSGIIVSDSASTSSQVVIGVGTITAGRPFVGTNTNTNPLEIGTRASQPLVFVTNSTECARIDASGNLGLGVTPSAWGGTYKGFQIGQGGLMSRTGGSDVYLLGNNYYDGTNFRYINTSFASRYQQDSGAHAWFTAPSGTAGNAITFTQAMTLDASGNLIVGNVGSGVSTATPIIVTAGSTFANTSGDAAKSKIRVYSDSGGAIYGFGVSTLLLESHVPASAGFAWFTNNTERARIDASGNFGVNVTNPASYAKAAFVNTAGSSALYAGSTTQGVYISNSTGTDVVYNSSGNSAGSHVWQTGNTERARITAAGEFLVAKTSTDVATVGTIITTDGRVLATTGDADCMVCNRQNSDGTLMEFRHANTTEGTISVSGNTVSYNAFAGSHWSQLQDGSKPDILRGTVMESINELCVWPGEQNERLPKSKISDTAGSKKVYGVFMAWDNDWTETNDMYVTAVGAFICRVNGSVTVQEGDLLESNGDGTARVQADDIIRSSTIGKVTSTVKTHQYDDGSYCVPTVLYCG